MAADIKVIKGENVMFLHCNQVVPYHSINSVLIVFSLTTIIHLINRGYDFK